MFSLIFLLQKYNIYLFLVENFVLINQILSLVFNPQVVWSEDLYSVFRLDNQNVQNQTCDKL